MSSIEVPAQSTITAPAAVDDPKAQTAAKVGREGKVIIRNIPFDLKDTHLKKDFGKYGTILDVNLPIKNENNLNRGFGFIEFSTKEEAKKLIDAMNGQKYKGRPIVVELSLPKGKYETKVTHIMANTNQTRQDIIQPKPVKEEKQAKEAVKVAKEAETKKIADDKIAAVAVAEGLKTKTQQRKDKKALKLLQKEQAEK